MGRIVTATPSSSGVFGQIAAWIRQRRTDVPARDIPTVTAAKIEVVDGKCLPERLSALQRERLSALQRGEWDFRDGMLP